MRFCKKALFTLILPVIGLTPIVKVKAQTTPSIQWQKAFGGYLTETPVAFFQNPDSSYIVAGITVSHDGDAAGRTEGSNSYHILKLTSGGVLQWHREYGGHGAWNELSSIARTTDGGYIASGTSGSQEYATDRFHCCNDIWVIKLDTAGVLQWQRLLGGSEAETGSVIKQTSDGGYIVGCTSRSSNGDITSNHDGPACWIVKLSAGGAIQWQKTIVDAGSETFKDIMQASDGSYMVTGAGLLVKLDGDGAVVWRSFTETDKTIEVPGTGFILTSSHIAPGHRSYDYFVKLIDNNGVTQWQKYYGGSGSDMLSDIKRTANGYIITGMSQSTDGDVAGNNSNKGCWLVNINDTGSIQWQYVLPYSLTDPHLCLVDGGYAVAATSTDGANRGNHGDRDFLIVRLDLTGHIKWTQYLGGSKIEAPNTIIQTFGGGYAIMGSTTSNDGNVSGYHHGEQDYWVVKLKADSALVATSVINFTATKTGNDINVNWQTQGEVNSKTYTIERSTNGINFTTFASVPAAATNATTAQAYSRVDTSVNRFKADSIYYRLKKTNTDNSTSFSKTIYVYLKDDHVTKIPGIQWQKSFGHSNYSDHWESVGQTTDGGCILAGAFNLDYMVVKLDANGSVEWQKVLGGSGDDHPYSIQQTTDGGYIVAGSSRSPDGDVVGVHRTTFDPNQVKPDFWVVKLSSTGAIQWQRALGGYYEDFAYVIRQTADGGYIVGGRGEAIDPSTLYLTTGLFIYKLDNTGATQWQKNFGILDNSTNYGRVAVDLQQTIDGGYIIAGGTSVNAGHYYIAKTDANGNKQWDKVIGGNSTDIARAIRQTADGNYIVAGYSYSRGGDMDINYDLTINSLNQPNTADIWIMKLNAAGDIYWKKNYGSASADEVRALSTTADGGFVIAGTTSANDHDVTGNHGGGDFWISRMNNDGVILWQKSLGGSNGDKAYAMATTADGGYILAGYAGSGDGDVTGNNSAARDSTAWVVKLTPDAVVLPVTLLNFAGKLVKNDAVLNWQTATEINSSHFNLERSFDGVNFKAITTIAATGNNNAGSNYSYVDAGVTGLDMPVIYYRLKMVDKDGSQQYSRIIVFNIQKNGWDIELLPNPVNSVIRLVSSSSITKADITVTDVSGKIVSRLKNNLVAGQVLQVPVAQLPAGVYILTVANKGAYKHIKVIKQ